MSVTPDLPGPKGSFLFGNLPEFAQNPLRFIERCAREYGDFVPMRFVNRPVVLLNHPDLIESVLVTQSKNFRKTLGYRTPFMRRLFGQGLLTSEGALWTQQRRLAQPAFHRQRIAGYAKVIVGFAQQMLSDWKSETREVHEDVMKLTTRVVVKTLFDADVPPAINELGKASTVVLEQFSRQWSFWRMWASLLPNPRSRRFEKVLGDLDQFIFSLIAQARASGQDKGDLLSMLLLARDEAGNGMSDQQLRDELVTLMVAGLDTTALAVSWALFLLAKNPEVQGRAQAGVRQVLGTRPPEITDLPQLPYIDAVLKESMRLYPPAWVVGREALADCEVQGRRIRKGTSFIMSQWLMHRSGCYFRDASEFRPDRWLEDSIKELPKFAYFPFGGGPRICIGNTFAIMEATLVLSSILQRFGVSCVPEYDVQPWPSITLQPKGGIWLKVNPV